MSNHDGGAPAWLTSDYIEAMLKNAFKDDQLRVDNFTIKPASSVGDNYLGQLFRLEVNYRKSTGKETRSIIVKSLPETKLNDSLGKQMDVFKVEAKMFSETLPLLHDELRVKGESERFFPFMYKLDMDRKTIFMEDLKAEGYVMANKVESLDLDHTLFVIKALAKMHASSYFVLKKDPTLKKHYLNHIYLKTEEKPFMETMAENAEDNNIKTLHLWPISEEDKKILRSFKGRLWNLVADSYEMKESNFNVLIHGDCWTNNMMFRYNKNGKVDSVKLLDFQISNYNSFALDLHYFIFLCSQEYVKLQHIDDVLKAYYETFVGVTGKIDGFTLDFVKKEFADKIGFGFVCGIYFRCGMMSDTPYDVDSEIEGKCSDANDEFYTNPKYISEAVKLLPLFKKYGIFK